MTNKLIIAKSGFNALTETNPDHLRFSSDYPTLKYFMSGTETLSITGNGSTQYAEKQIAHNLGVKPLFFCFVNFGTGYFPIPRNESTVAPNTTLYASGYIDQNNLHLVLQTNYANPQVASVTFAYKIFRNITGL